MIKLNRFLPQLICLISGALLTLAFAPFHVFPFSILSPLILLLLWLRTSPRGAFWRGWWFGIGLFSTGVYWIFISIHTYGDTDAWVALLVTALLIAILALFPAVTGYLLNRYFPSNNFTKMALAFPSIWVFFEWMRSWFFSGFPWLSIGYSQLYSPLKGYAPLLSVYALSLLALMSSGLFAYLIKIMVIKQTTGKPTISKKYIYVSLVLLVGIWLTGAILSLVTWTRDSGKQIRVSLVQGNIAQSLKWSPEQVQPTLDRYVALTQQHWDSQIIVWPEAAIPVPLHISQDFLNNLAYQAKNHHSTLITGIPVQAPDKENYYNAVIAIGEGTGIYFKQRLVPFGEFIPMKSVFGRIFDLLQVPMSDFIPGVSGVLKPIEINGIKIATFICYEIAYPEQVLSHDGNIDLLLTVSNDAWFGHSIAQAQHLEMAQMRALEMGRPVLFASNDGITAIINTHGQIQSEIPPHQTLVLTDVIKTAQGKTPWQRSGLDPLLALMILLTIIAWVYRHSHD